MAAPLTSLDEGALLLDPVADTNPLTRRSRWWVEILAIGWLCWIYDDVSNLAHIRQQAATLHAAGVLHLERVLHLDPERALNYWLAAHHGLALWASEYYDNAHFVVTFAVAAWLWWRHPAVYRPLRTALVVINVIGFLVFWVFPMAPPRMLPAARVVDVVAGSHALGAWHAGSLASHANQLAAMPSLHMAWAMWCGLALWRVFRRRRPVTLVWIYPVLTALVVMATGNHFTLDLLAGIATMILAVTISDRGYRWWGQWPRVGGLRPPAWPAEPAEPAKRSRAA